MKVNRIPAGGRPPGLGVLSQILALYSVYRADGQAARLGVGETLSDAEVLPGFTCPVADVFPRQPAGPA